MTRHFRRSQLTDFIGWIVGPIHHSGSIFPTEKTVKNAHFHRYFRVRRFCGIYGHSVSRGADSTSGCNAARVRVRANEQLLVPNRASFEKSD
jgi:hypothetical protein